MPRWNEVANEIFLRALEHDPLDKCQAYLDDACGTDAQLRAEVDSLLEARAHLSGFLERPPAAVAAPIDQPPAEQPGTMIGPYKLIEEIGEGGMGSVFMALQKAPVRRKVALKVIKPGMDSRQVVSRFEAERQALAMMDHPNIARVFDGGATESGRPYFVMELVHGIPITDYCDQYRLTTDERLELFGDVCRAVQHAHQKGIIHRDLKPSNILVTLLDGRAIPKVIDFGVAKATRGHLTEETLVTHFAQMIGTPLYMSPEQTHLSAADVDTRSDVYSLGVLLYELLTGTPPFDHERMRSVSFDEFRRIVREEDPPKPSARLTTLNAALETVAYKHHTDPRTLCHEVAGELDWIVMKALEKDRSRRYVSANELAKDVQRHLDDEPVEACAPSVTYRVRKFTHRNRWRLIVATSLLLMLLAGIAGTTTGWMSATQAEAEARRDAMLEAEARGNAERERRRATTLLARMHLERGVRRMNTQDHRGLLNLVDAWMVSDENPELQSAIGRLWALGHDACAGRLVHIIPAGCSGLAFSPNGKLLATAKDSTAQMWDLATGQPHGRPLELEKVISTVLFSPDGERIAAHSVLGEARLWETQTQEPVGPVLRHDPPDEADRELGGEWPRWSKWSAAFSHDGKLLATGALDGAVRLWTTKTGQPHGKPFPHKKKLCAVAFSPNDQFLTTGSQVGIARMWDVASGQPHGPPLLSELPGNPGDMIPKVAFSPDGKLLATMCTDGIATLRETETGHLHKLLRDRLWNEWGWMTDLVFSPDGKQAATASVDWTLQLWDTSTGERLGDPMRHNGRVQTLSFTPDGKLLASGSDDQTSRLWNTATGEPYGPGMYHRGRVVQVVFSPDGKFLVVNDGDAQIWRVNWQADGPAPEEPYNRRISVTSPDRRFRATITEDQTVELVDTATGTTVNDWFPERGVKTIAFSPDSKLLATGSSGWRAKIWEVVTGRLRQTLNCPERVYGVAFSPDERTLATGLLNGTVQLWDFAAGHPRGLPLRHKSPVWGVAFSPDGKLLASVSGMDRDNSNNLWIWDVTTSPDYLGLALPHIPVRGQRTLSSFSLRGTLDVGMSDETARAWHLPEPRSEFHEMRLLSWIALGLQQNLQGQTGAISAELWDLLREELRVLEQPHSIPTSEANDG